MTTARGVSGWSSHHSASPRRELRMTAERLELRLGQAGGELAQEGDVRGALAIVQLALVRLGLDVAGHGLEEHPRRVGVRLEVREPGVDHRPAAGRRARPRPGRSWSSGAAASSSRRRSRSIACRSRLDSKWR